MRPPLRASLATLILAALFTAPAPADTFHLGEGRRIEGDVVKETTETVFVDVGWTILAVPKKEILRREKAEAAAGGSDERAVEADLYRTVDRKAVSVKDNVARVGSAVVMVSTPGGTGSGFLLTPDGYLITNDHVIHGETDITISLFESTGDEEGEEGFSRRKVKDVRIVATNAYADLALLKIDGEKDLPVAYLGASERVRVGEAVFAIGNPLGLERSVSEGIVSTLARPFDGLIYLQTTTQINPGNSGGPLFNLKGEVIGVTNMGYMFSEGLNFAIPVSTVKWFLRHRDSFAYDQDNPNTGFRYLPPPRKPREDETGDGG